MTELGLRPRSSTELVDAAFQVFRREPVSFIVAAALLYVPWLLIRLALEPQIVTLADFDLPRVLLTGVLGLLVYVIAAAVATLIARDVYLDRPVDVAGAFRAVVPRVATLIVTTLITFTFLVIGAMLFIFPVLYPLARFFAVRQAIMLEGAGVGRALGRSSELSVGVKRHVLATLLLAGLITVAISVGSGLLANIIPSRVLLFAISTAASVIVYPFLAIVQTLLYYDVRIRKEGFDIEYLAGSVPRDAAGEAGA
jgi:hypothetical protein